MSRWFAALVFAMCGCVKSASVDCGGRVCPHDTVCIELIEAAADSHRCVEEAAIAACDGIVELADCAAGACYKTTTGLVCLPSGCGNGLRDASEICDDGNADIGDGCSASCLSNETCGNGVLDGLDFDDQGNARPGEACDDGNLVGHDGCASGCDVERPAWTDVTPDVPGRRMRAAMAYDPVRRRIVMVGGHRQEGPSQVSAIEEPLPDIWENDGHQWVQRHPSEAPSARVGTAVVYDIAQHVTVLFGGLDDHARSDLWSWNGVRWRRLVPSSSPSGRFRHGLAYDGRRKVVVLFGGTDEAGKLLGDTWEWNGNAWKQMTPATSPPPREAAMAYDPVRGVIVMVGLPEGGSDYETWEYDGLTWTQKSLAMAAPGPGGSTPTSLAFDVASARILALGRSTTYSWDGTTWNDLAAPLPGQYEGASLAADPDGHVVLFGGQYFDDTGILAQYVNRADTFVWTGTSWAQQVLDAPEPRFYASAVLDARRRTVVVVGGYDNSTTYQQTLEYDGFSWTKPPGAPWSSGRYAASIAYDEGRDQIVVFGGTDAAHVLNAETWIRASGAWANPAPALSPPARVDGAMAYDPARQQVVLFGGGDAANDGATFGDTWVWDGASWSLKTPAHSPVDRRGAVLAWDARLSQLVLFGGLRTRTIGNTPSAIDLGDTWTWDGTDWTEHTTSLAPSARHSSALAPDPMRRTLVLFGGMDPSGAVSDSWEWDGATWHALAAVDRPTPRTGHTMTAAPGGSGLVVFGGSDGNFYANGETKSLQWVGDADYETCAVPIDSDGDGLAGCSDVDCWARCAPMCPPGVACDPMALRCGDGTCSPLEDCRSCPADCTTCPDRCGDAVCDPAELVATCPGDCTP